MSEAERALCDILRAVFNLHKDAANLVKQGHGSFPTEMITSRLGNVLANMRQADVVKRLMPWLVEATENI